MKRVFISIALVVLLSIMTITLPSLSLAAEGTITNGTQFKDASGNVIHAHGGGMINYEGYYYWYGEYRDSSNHFLGVRCYKSADLVNWEFRGEVLSPNSASELAKCNVERPKVMYNASTKEFVMWMHWENGVHYGEAKAAVAYCKTPDGKYTYQGSFRPYASSGVMDHDSPGYMSRDCNVFVDTDGKGYFISSSNENMDLHLYELTPDYKNIASLKTKLYVGKQREAPCLIKRNDYYYLITSGCTGWDPNQSKYAYSKNLASGWSDLFNLGDSTTYKSQPAFIIPVQGSKATTYLYTGDRWAGAWEGKVNDSQYVWLPLEFKSDTSLQLPFYSNVKINVAEGTITEPGLDTKYKIVNKNSGKLLDAKDGTRASQLVQWTDNRSASQIWYLVDMGSGYKKIVSASSGYVLDVQDNSTENGGAIIQWYSNGGYNQQWQFIDAGDDYYKVKNRSSGKILDVNKWSTDDGGLIQQWEDSEGSNQYWRFVPVSDVQTQTPKPTQIETPTPTPNQNIVKGDVDGNGTVNSIDFGYMRMYLLGTINKFPTSDPNVGYLGADIDNSGMVNSIDFGYLRQVLLGMR